MTMKNKEKQKNVSIFRMVRLVLPKMCKATPVLFWLQAALSIIHGSSWGLQTIAMQRFFDAATAMAGNAALFLQAVSALLLLCGAYVLTQVLNGVANYLPSVMMNKQQGIFNREVNQKIARLPAIDFENPDRLDDISKAGWGCDSAAWLTFTVLNVFIFYLPYFVVMGWYLFSLKPTLALAILIVFVPTALTQLIRARYFTDLEKESAPVRRQYDYYEQCMTAREYFKETRLLGGFSFFKNLYLNALQTLQKLNFKATMKSNLFELSMRIVTVIGYCLILWMLFIALLNREISIGAFSAVFSSIGILYSIMEEVVCRNFGNIAQNMGKVSNYIRFLELEDAKGTVDTPPGWGDIRLEHVTFRYPLTEKDAVCNVSLTLKKGETLAIVGENGSGKSTLVKLLCGLYLPDSGSVCINGTDTKTLTFRAMFQNISAVFQRYEPFKLTLRENITISESDKEIKEPELESVCAAAGVEVDGPSYPQRFDTMLSREFDGVDLSGGQWQRVAIARGFYRTHNVIVLDEPTAAIDPFEETKIYNRFAQISKNKSAVIVTHRLGSVKLADRIAVMKDGALVQVGTHAELIAKDGEYKRLYQAQEKWYQKKVKV